MNDITIKILKITPSFPNLNVVFYGNAIRGENKGKVASLLNFCPVQEGVRLELGDNSWDTFYIPGDVHHRRICFEFDRTDLGVEKKLLGTCSQNKSLDILAIEGDNIYNICEEDGDICVQPTETFIKAASFYSDLIIKGRKSLSKKDSMNQREKIFHLQREFDKLKPTDGSYFDLNTDLEKAYSLLLTDILLEP